MVKYSSLALLTGDTDYTSGGHAGGNIYSQEVSECV